MINNHVDVCIHRSIGILLATKVLPTNRPIQQHEFSIKSTLSLHCSAETAQKLKNAILERSFTTLIGSLKGSSMATI